MPDAASKSVRFEGQTLSCVSCTPKRRNRASCLLTKRQSHWSVQTFSFQAAYLSDPDSDYRPILKMKLEPEGKERTNLLLVNVVKRGDATVNEPSVFYEQVENEHNKAKNFTYTAMTPVKPAPTDDNAYFFDD